MLPPPPRSTLFPYTTLFRSASGLAATPALARNARGQGSFSAFLDGVRAEARRNGISANTLNRALSGLQDRKSTRLNSSHVEISYAVFCLKKKNKKNVLQLTT